jgi:hypothetical protein
VGRVEDEQKTNRSRSTKVSASVDKSPTNLSTNAAAVVDTIATHGMRRTVNGGDKRYDVFEAFEVRGCTSDEVDRSIRMKLFATFVRFLDFVSPTGRVLGQPHIPLLVLMPPSDGADTANPRRAVSR